MRGLPCVPGCGARTVSDRGCQLRETGALRSAYGLSELFAILCSLNWCVIEAEAAPFWHGLDGKVSMGGWSMQLNITLEEGRVLDQALQTIIKRPDVANIIDADYRGH